MPNPPKKLPTDHRKLLGNQGEQLAKKLLQNKGYTFLSQNYRTKIGEIDLIFRKDQTIVFVEVKTRHKLDQGLPEEAVTPRKLWTIERVGEQYLLETNQYHCLARIDVVAIEFITDPPQIRHLENVTG